MTTAQPEKLGLGELRYPDADPRLKKWSFGNLLAFTGPGMILASVTIGNGEVFSASRGGAVFGLTILWTFVLCAIMKAAIVYSGARYIALTGEHPFQRWAQIIPGPRNWLALTLGVLAVICFPSWAVAFFQGLGQWSNWTFHTDIDPKIWGLIWGLIAFATVFLRSFKVVENFQTVVVGLMILFSFVALFVSNPPWVEAFLGLIPNIPSEYPGWVQDGYADVAARPIPLEIIAYLGALGGGSYDYIGYVGTLRAKKWGMLGAPNHAEIEEKLNRLDTDSAGEIPLATDAENVDNGRAWLRAVKLDILASFVSVTILAITFVMLGDVILGTGAAEAVPDNDNILVNQAQFFSVISPVLVYLYQLAIWAAFFGSLQALSTIYPYTVREAFGPSFTSVRKEENFHRLRIWVNVYTFGGATILLFSGIEYVTVISFAGVLGGVLSLGIWGFAQLWTEKKALPAPFRMRTWVAVVVFASSTFLTAAGLLALVQFFMGFFG